MGISYEFYNPETGKSLNPYGDKFAGMPFFKEEYKPVRCAIKMNYDNRTIERYTTDENDKLFQEYFYGGTHLFGTHIWANDYWTDYITREQAVELQKHMAVNNTLLTDFMDKAGCDALIMDVSY